MRKKIPAKDAEKLLKLLECLTGYVESRDRKGDRTAPIEHANEARELINKLRG